MAYRHKLSCRLALLRDLFMSLLCVVAVATCEPATALVTGPTSRVTQIVVVPETLTVDPAQLTKFVPYGRATTGDTVGVAVTWTASGGTITSTGMYTPDTTAGDFVVTATSAQLALSGSSLVHNRGRRAVASVSVAPTPATVSVGQTVQLTATTRDAGGTALTGRVVTWGTSSAAVATVSGSGLVTAVAPGAATITATSETKTGAASVTVTAVSVASVGVTPASPSITSGQTVQLTATPKDANGTALTGRTVTWTSSNAAAATVNGSGLVTGVAAGSATITATCETKSGSAAVTVTAAGGGGTVLIQENFQDAAFAARGWYDNPGMTITSAQYSPGSTSALEVHFTPGAGTPTWGGAARHQFQPTSTLYVSYWVKYSTNWVGSGQLDHPHEFYVLSNLDGQYSGLASDWLTTYIETNFVNGAGTPRVSLQDNLAINTSYGAVPINLIGITENRSVSGCNGVVETNLFAECYGGSYNDKQFNRGGTVTFRAAAGAGYKGDWNHVETYFQINSIVNGVAQPDGIVQYWFNGTLIIDRHDVLFRAGARSTLSFAQFVIAPYIGNGSPVDQYMWVDNLTVATGKP